MNTFKTLTAAAALMLVAGAAHACPGASILGPDGTRRCATPPAPVVAGVAQAGNTLNAETNTPSWAKPKPAPLASDHEIYPDEPAVQPSGATQTIFGVAVCVPDHRGGTSCEVINRDTSDSLAGCEKIRSLYPYPSENPSENSPTRRYLTTMGVTATCVQKTVPVWEPTR